MYCHDIAGDANAQGVVRLILATSTPSIATGSPAECTHNSCHVASTTRTKETESGTAVVAQVMRPAWLASFYDVDTKHGA